jgi:beta-glucosidase
VYQPSPSRLHSGTMEAIGAAPRNLILVDDVLNSAFLTKQAPAITVPRDRGYTLQWVDRHAPSRSPVHLPTQPTLVQLFIRGTPFRGNTELLQTAQNCLQALVLYGSPYVLEPLVSQLPADVPYVFSYGQMPLAQSIALDALFAQSIGESPIALNRQFTD